MVIGEKSKPEANRPPRFFHVWRCERTRESQPWGKPAKEPCGKWSVKASKWDLGVSDHLQANCPNCGRRSRLNGRYVKTCATRNEANDWCAFANEEGME